MDSSGLTKEPLIYEISDELEGKLATCQRAVCALHWASRVWSLTDTTTAGGITPIPTAFVRTPISANQNGTSLRVQTNVTPAVLHLPNGSYYFFPDQLLICRKETISQFAYSDLCIESRALRFLERAEQPEDADQIGHVHGSLDDATRVPIFRYGSVEMHVGSTRLMHLLTSRTDSANQFALEINGLLPTTTEPLQCTPESLYTHFEPARVPRYYQISDAGIRQMQRFREAFLSIALSEYVWRYEDLQKTEDWRRNAGASLLIKRKRIFPEVIPQHAGSIDSNAMVAFVAGSCTLHIFPDDCLVQTAHGCKSIGKNLDVEVKSCTFREEEANPTDSEMVGSTWRYINRDGGPDLRFSQNRKIPIYKYGEIVLTSDEGFRLHLAVSQARTAFRFAELLKATKVDQKASKTERPYEGHAPHPPASAVTSTLTKALEFLELRPGASLEDASSAYRRLAKQNHPDRVADLAPEFRKLADARMRELNAAMATVRESFTPADKHHTTATA